MTRRILLLALFLPARLLASVVYSPGDVGSIQTAHDVANNGDTVMVEGTGTNWWSTNVWVWKGISIQSTGAVSLMDNLPGGVTGKSRSLFYLNTSSNLNYEVRGFNFLPGTNRSSIYFIGVIAAYGWGTVHINHNNFTHLKNNYIYIDDFVHGPIDHNYFMVGDHVHPISLNGHQWGGSAYFNGDFSWFWPANYGSADLINIQDNVFDCDAFDIGNTAHLDAFAGARWILTHNIIKNGFISTHGRETGQREDAPRQYEITYNDISQVTNLFSVTPQPFLSRGGSGVIAYNKFTGFRNGPGLALYRAHHAFPDHWGGADGLNNWDKNDPTLYANAIHTGTSGSRVLTSSGAGWTTNQWAGYMLVATNAPVSTNLATATVFVNHRFGEILSNSTDTVWTDDDGTGIGGQSEDCTIYMTNGIAYQIRKVIQAVDMPGAGSGDLLTGNHDETPVWLKQGIEGVYAWGNTNGDGSQSLVSAYQNNQLIEGIHFFNFAKPGYTPYTYPDPRTGESPGASPPDISAQPQDVSAASGASANFTVSSSGTATLLYQWQRFGTNLAGATATIYTTPTLTSADNLSTYQVIVTNDFGSITSRVATLNVLSPPTQFRILIGGQVNIGGQIKL